MLRLPVVLLAPEANPKLSEAYPVVLARPDSAPTKVFCLPSVVDSGVLLTPAFLPTNALVS